MNIWREFSTVAYHVHFKNGSCSCMVVISNHIGDWHGNEEESWERDFGGRIDRQSLTRCCGSGRGRNPGKLGKN